MQTYDPGKFTCSVAGIICEQYADGEMISLDNDEDAFKTYVGSDGKTGRSATRNETAVLTIKLSQQSPTNALLAAWLAADKAGIKGPGPLRIADLSGNSVYQAQECWVAKAPPVSFDREIKTREWKIAIGTLQRQDGGN